MGRAIHRCDTADGPRYREWSTIVDAYVTDTCTRAEMAAHLFDEAGAPSREPVRGELRAQIEARLARADAHGTSAHGDTRDTATWATERCEHGNHFHHALEAHCCDEPPEAPCHGPPCEGDGTTGEGSE